MKTLNVRDKNNHTTKFSATVDIVVSGEVKASQVIEARSKQEFDNNCKNLLTIADQVEADYAKIQEGEWTPPAEPKEEPKNDYELAKMELYVKKEERDLGLITDVEYNAEVAKVKLLNKEVISEPKQPSKGGGGAI